MAEKGAPIAESAGSGAKPKRRGAKRASKKTPPAGPHAELELTDKDKTPGSGVLSEPDQKQTEAPTG